LWETWWFEARNADALQVLAKMPGANVDAETKSRWDPSAKQTWVQGGYTAVMLAAQRNDSASIARLHELGADLNARDANGACALHHAAFADASDAVLALLDRGADGNARDARDGSTPAVLAAFGSRRKALRAFLEWNETTENPTLEYGIRDVGNATVAGHCAQRRLSEELTRILLFAGPGGAGRLRRGEKSYLGKKKELAGQLEVLSRDELYEIARRWRARPEPEDDAKMLIVKLLRASP
jgi:hypothetical protein